VTAEKQRFLVLHDYGMGGLWWWVWARSAREIRETFNEVEVILDEDSVARAQQEDDLDEVDIDAPVMPPGLDEARQERDAQRGRPGFGAFADREIVYLKRPWDEDEPEMFLMEIGADGRRLREVLLAEKGPWIRGDPADWPLNPPVVDLYDPALVGQEIGRDEFEAAWERAEWDPERTA
jgi:hypothetical protein